MNDQPFTIFDGDELLVHRSGKMPEFLRNKNLPDVPSDISGSDADLIVLTHSNKGYVWSSLDPTIILSLREAEKLILLQRIYDDLGIKPLIWEEPRADPPAPLPADAGG